MATFWERATHSVKFIVLFALCIFFSLSHLGFDGVTLILIAQGPSYCLNLLRFNNDKHSLARNTS